MASLRRRCSSDICRRHSRRVEMSVSYTLNDPDIELTDGHTCRTTEAKPAHHFSDDCDRCPPSFRIV